MSDYGIDGQIRVWRDGQEVWEDPPPPPWVAPIAKLEDTVQWLTLALGLLLAVVVVMGLYVVTL